MFSFNIESKDYLHVYETQNMRIKVIDPEGKTERTIKFDSYSMCQIRIQSSGQTILARKPRHSDFSEENKNLPKLIKRLDKEGSVIAEFV